MSAGGQALSQLVVNPPNLHMVFSRDDHTKPLMKNAVRAFTMRHRGGCSLAVRGWASAKETITTPRITDQFYFEIMSADRKVDEQSAFYAVGRHALFVPFYLPAGERRYEVRTELMQLGFIERNPANNAWKCYYQREARDPESWVDYEAAALALFRSAFERHDCDGELRAEHLAHAQTWRVDE